MIKQIFLSLAILLLCLASGRPALADETERVAVIINEDVVSVHDLDQRIRLALVASNLPDTVDTRSRVAPAVVHHLIDEHIELQEAAKEKVTVGSSELDNAIFGIEVQSQMPKGSFEPFLKSHGIELSTVREQVRAEIAWQEVVSREVSPEAHVPEEAVTERLETLKDNLGKPEYLVSEIFLPVEHPRDDAEVRSFGERLIEQMRQGAPFAQLALQFSATGAGGGNLGWVSDGMIDPVLLEALARVPVNAVTSPVRTADGYHLLLLNAKRQVGDGYSRGPQAELLTIDLTSLPSSNQADRAAQLARLKSVLAPAKNCDDLERLTKQVPSATFNPRSKVAMRGLPANIRALAENLEPGQISDAVESDANTVRVVAVCQRFPDTGGLPAREDVRRQMENERIDLQARRFLRELKREAYIEVRI